MSDTKTPGDYAAQKEAEARERAAAVVPASSGRQRHNGAFIALNMSTADGVLEAAMAHAMRTGDVNSGYILSAYSNTRWRYDITCVDYDANALTVAAFLGKVSKSAPLQLFLFERITIGLERKHRATPTGSEGAPIQF